MAAQLSRLLLEQKGGAIGSRRQASTGTARKLRATNRPRLFSSELAISKEYHKGSHKDEQLSDEKISEVIQDHAEVEISHGFLPIFTPSSNRHCQLKELTKEMKNIV
ncbi:hypothetical protein QAD02_021079 [Eretmocerus hayati]|uniref:Uncharacterized protein n=1 Tax=Eretmocerus hayati TaxID=131215 RepID=A0ACC2PR49_9HYME|nr:hypothetical protein QAD02_021079 [Eretmocerus hayati]